MYSPNIPPLDSNEYGKSKSKSTIINHFYEKLFHIKNKIKTRTGKTIAFERHQFMIIFMKQFFNEINQ